MPTQIAPSAVQLAPASQPEEKIQELANRHRKHEMRGQSFDFARLRVRSPLSVSLSYSVLLEHVQLWVDRYAFEIHRGGWACRVDMMLTALIVLALLQLYRWQERGGRGFPRMGEDSL